MDKEQIKDKIVELSNKIHQQTLRGGAELILLSERAYETIESELEGNMLNERFHVIQPSEWNSPPMAPCDIRAIYFGGNVEVKRIGNRKDVSYGDNLDQVFHEESTGSMEDVDTENMSGEQISDTLGIPEVDLGFTEDSVEDVIQEHTFDVEEQ